MLGTPGDRVTSCTICRVLLWDQPVKGSEIPIRKVRRKETLAAGLPLRRRTPRVLRDKVGSSDRARSESRRSKNHGASALSLTNEDRLDFVRARDQLAKLGATIGQAVEFYAMHHAAAPEISVANAVER